MPFFEDTRGRQVALASIRTTTIDHKDRRVRGETMDGDRFEVAQSIYEEAKANWFQSTIPAMPGTYLLIPCLGDDFKVEEYTRQSVFAWGVTHDGSAMPIALEGTRGGYAGVLQPDGRVEVPHNVAYDSLEAFMIAMDVPLPTDKAA